MNKVEEWRFIFQECKVCGNYFLARSGHYELCSDKCRKVKSTQAKREYNERLKDDALTQAYESAYQYWFNRWRNLKNGKNANADAAVAFKAEFDIFRAEAKKRKKVAKRNKAEEKAFTDWLFQQQGEADRLVEKLAPKVD